MLKKNTVIYSSCLSWEQINKHSLIWIYNYYQIPIACYKILKCQNYEQFDLVKYLINF